MEEPRRKERREERSYEEGAMEREKMKRFHEESSQNFTSFNKIVELGRFPIAFCVLKSIMRTHR